jgi:ribonucleoside-diphosphate reductase alpha chain
MEHYAWTVGLTRMISAVFRRSADVGFVAEELKAVFDPRGGAWMQGRYVPSLLAAIGDIVERHLEGLAGLRPAVQASSRAFTADAAHRAMPACPQCGASALVKVEGCNNCLECGYSKCG